MYVKNVLENKCRVFCYQILNVLNYLKNISFYICSMPQGYPKPNCVVCLSHIRLTR